MPSSPVCSECLECQTPTGAQEGLVDNKWHQGTKLAHPPMHIPDKYQVHPCTQQLGNLACADNTSVSMTLAWSYKPNTSWIRDEMSLKIGDKHVWNFQCL